MSAIVSVGAGIRCLVLSAVLALTLGQQAVVAETVPAVEPDLQCFGVFMYMGGQASEPDAKAWFTGQAQYHLGRLQARSPEIDWLERLTDYFSSGFPGEFAEVRPRCGTQAEARDEALDEWSRAFMAKVEAARAAQ